MKKYEKRKQLQAALECRRDWANEIKGREERYSNVCDLIEKNLRRVHAR